VAPDAVKQEVASALVVRFGDGCCVKVHNLPVGGLVGGPRRQAGTVGVAGTGEVGPVLLDLGRKGAVFGPPNGLLTAVKGAENVLNVVGMERADPRRVKLVTRRNEVKSIAINRSMRGSN